MIDITNDVPMPVTKPKPERKPRKKKSRVTPALREAAKQYKHAYIAVYGLRPTLTFDGTWIRLQGMAQGVSLKRLKEMTTQLRNRAG